MRVIRVIRVMSVVMVIRVIRVIRVVRCVADVVLDLSYTSRGNTRGSNLRSEWSIGGSIGGPSGIHWHQRVHGHT